MTIESKDYEEYVVRQVQSIIRQLNANSAILEITDNSFCLEEWKQLFFETLKRKLKETPIFFKEIYLHKSFCDETIEKTKNFLIQRNEDKVIDINQLTR